MIAALFVQTNGCYFGLDGVDPWDEARDARLYDGPHSVVAHPPCERWGKYWNGGPSAKVKRKLGDDDGKFASALVSVRRFGGVIEHPEGSAAWKHFGLSAPPCHGGWVVADFNGGWTCCVEQGHYGHISRKATWLYAVGCELPSMHWGSSGQRLDPKILERHGYEYARRCGVIAMIGGKDKSILRAATPPEFRDLLLSIAASAAVRSFAA
jgi:hypothetical protein